LCATRTKDLSQAARVASKYLRELGFELSHSKALDLAARMTGFPNHMAAQASLRETTEDKQTSEVRTLLDPEVLKRVEMQFEVGTGQPLDCDAFLAAVQTLGLQPAVERVMRESGVVIGLGDFLIQSAAEQGFWSETFGWVLDKSSATGYSGKCVNKPLVFLGVYDAQWVRYSDAVDFDPDASEEPRSRETSS